MGKVTHGISCRLGRSKGAGWVEFEEEAPRKHHGKWHGDFLVLKRPIDFSSASYDAPINKGQRIVDSMGYIWWSKQLIDMWGDPTPAWIKQVSKEGA